MSKLALGTVQFGLDYGINNQRGKIPESEVFEILELAAKNGITTLDTAHTYGNSEAIIGDFIKKTDTHFEIVSKLPVKNIQNIESHLQETLERVGQKELYACLFHHFSNYAANPDLLEQIKQYKAKGLVRKVGFSLYYLEELHYLLENKIDFDLLQVPYNVFDRRFEPYFEELKRSGKEIHTRSAFLQGLFMKPVEELDGKFMKIVPKVFALQKAAEKLKISVSALCLNFCIINPNIDKVIIGVDNKENLTENITSLEEEEKVRKIEASLRGLIENDEEIIIPVNWR